MRQRASLFLSFLALVRLAASEADLTFTSSFDGSVQLASLFIPDPLPAGPRPLVAVAHYWGGDRHSARGLGYVEECQRRGWLLVCPELHGQRTSGKTSLAALEAQHDLVDAIRAVQARQTVDATRIYLAGQSMGGMLVAMTAAKYPDLFAAAVAGQGISDLRQFMLDTPSLAPGVVAECGPDTGAGDFAYRRRSPLVFASNLAYVPLIMWHGSNDTIVPPEHSERLLAAIRAVNRFTPEVHWLPGAPHGAGGVAVPWVFDRLAENQLVAEPGHQLETRYFPRLQLVTDEDKRIFWLDIARRDPGDFARVTASLAGGVLRLETRNTARLGVDLRRVAVGTEIASYEVASDGPLEVTISGGLQPFAVTVADGARAPLTVPLRSVR